MKGRLLADRNEFLRNTSEDLGRCADMGHGFEVRVPDRLQDVGRTLHVRLERVERRGERRLLTACSKGAFFYAPRRPAIVTLVANTAEEQ